MCYEQKSVWSSLHTFMFVQLANFIWANCVAGVREFVLPNIGDVVADRFIFIGVLWNENARVTCKWSEIFFKTVERPTFFKMFV